MSAPSVELPKGMANLEYPITQVSLAVRDLDGTMERYHRAFGWAPWQVFDHVPPVHHRTELRGQPVDYSLRGAEVYVGSLNFELLQPLAGPNLWSEFMDRRGEGDRVDRDDVPRAGGRRRGQDARSRTRFDIDVIMKADIGDHIEYYYLDTEEQFGCLIESGSGHAIDFVSPAQVYPHPGAEPARRRSAASPIPSPRSRSPCATSTAKMQAYHEAFGWGPWKIFESDGDAVMHDCEWKGKPAEFQHPLGRDDGRRPEFRAHRAARRRQPLARVPRDQGRGHLVDRRDVQDRRGIGAREGAVRGRRASASPRSATSATTSSGISSTPSPPSSASSSRAAGTRSTSRLRTRPILIEAGDWSGWSATVELQSDAVDIDPVRRQARGRDRGQQRIARDATPVGAGRRRVALIARRRERLEAIAAEIGPAAGAIVLPADCTDEAVDLRRRSISAAAAFGGLDIVVSNAGIELLGEDDRVDRLEAGRSGSGCSRNNLDGQFLACKHGIRHLLAAGGGAVVCVGSNTGYLGMATQRAGVQRQQRRRLRHDAGDGDRLRARQHPRQHGRARLHRHADERAGHARSRRSCATGATRSRSGGPGTRRGMRGGDPAGWRRTRRPTASGRRSWSTADKRRFEAGAAERPGRRLKAEGVLRRKERDKTATCSGGAGGKARSKASTNTRKPVQGVQLDLEVIAPSGARHRAAHSGTGAASGAPVLPG